MKATDDTIPMEGKGSSGSSEPDKPVSGERYRFGSELGRGGMGRVVEAFDSQLGRAVALKEMLPKGGPNEAKRFAREVQITARLEHASIVPLYDSGNLPDGRPYYVMRRVSGQPLDQLIAKTTSLAERVALLPNVLAAIDAIAHAHKRGVIHRDIKPSNILVGELGETVVIDWGLAKVVGEQDDSEPHAPIASDSLHTQAGSVFGTPGFMPPEQARGEELGPRSDVFALGATLYHVLAGRPPLVGKSATEVLEATYKHKLVPIVQAQPNAPPELVAIVEKALAFEASARYANAGELAEDVRRYTTGQLVAAHRYSPRERLARFVRRYRAPLGVAAIALAAVAVLSVVSVRRIVLERDVAHAAESTALAQRAQAEAASRALAENADHLRVWRAQALLEQNPTMALASLADVMPAAAALGEARATAQAAVMRGVAVRMATLPGFATSSTLSLDTRWLAHTMIDGTLAVYDLDTRTRVLQKAYARGTRAVWLGDNLLLYGHDETELIDPKTGDAKPAKLPACELVVATEHGRSAVCIDPTHHAHVIDDGVVRTLSATGVTDAAIDREGTWYALAGEHGVDVFEANDHLLAHHDGSVVLLVPGTRRLAATADHGSKLLELALDPKPTWTEHAADPGDMFLWAVYRDDTLYAATPRHSLAPIGASWAGSGHTLYGVWADDAVVAIASDGMLHVWAPAGHVATHLPAAVREPRVVGRPRKSRIVVVADGEAFVYELADFVARAIDVPVHGEADFVTEDLVIVHGMMPEWGWYDLANDKFTPMETYFGQNALFDVDPAGRRVLRAAQTEAASARLYVAQPGAKDRLLATIPPLPLGRGLSLARFVPGGGIAWAEGVRVMVAIGDAAPRELAKLDGKVLQLAPCGHLRVAALGANGELVRGHLASGSLERLHVDLGDSVTLACDTDGNVLVGSGRTLWRWDASFHELATVDSSIVAVHAVDGGGVLAIGVQLAVDLVRDGLAPRRLLGPSSALPAVSRDGRVALGTGNGDQLVLAEPLLGATWTLPWTDRGPPNALAVSPARRVAVVSEVTHRGTRLLVEHLPAADPTLRAWIAGLTNAQISPDGALEWRQ